MRWFPSLNMQCLLNLPESGERSILKLGSLCLPCYVWCYVIEAHRTVFLYCGGGTWWYFLATTQKYNISYTIPYNIVIFYLTIKSKFVYKTRVKYTIIDRITFYEQPDYVYEVCGDETFSDLLVFIFTQAVFVYNGK